MINKIEDYLNKGSYPYFSACEKIYTIHGKEEFIVGKDKYFSIMDTYIAKCITDKDYNKDEVIENLINTILAQLELKAYNNATSIIADKVRLNGKVSQELNIPEYCSIDKRDILIVDDICDGGATFIELAKIIKPMNPSSLTLFVTHGIFSKGFEPLYEFIDKIYYTGSLTSGTLKIVEDIRSIDG
jgi:phosphoribosylpyrophosphate synthetase